MDIRERVLAGGQWQMNEKRTNALVRKWKVTRLKSNRVARDIRISSVRGANESSGVSADENFSTETQVANAGNMSQNEAQMAFEQRSHQGVLVWKTDSPSLTQYGLSGDTSEPVSGHTPSIKHNALSGTSGAMTKEHGRRNEKRAEIVTKTLSDPSRNEADSAVVARLATHQLFTSPKDELVLAAKKVRDSSQPIYSVFKDIGKVSGVGRETQFGELAERVNTAREKDKMHSALSLMTLGYNNLVPELHQEILRHTNGDVDKAMTFLQQQSVATNPQISFNNAPSSQTDRLDQMSLREMNAAPVITRPRALSLPRRVKYSTIDL